MLSHQLMALMLLHQYSTLNIQVRIPNWKNKVDSLKDLESLVWGILKATTYFKDYLISDWISALSIKLILAILVKQPV